MKISPRQADRFIDNPDETICAVLVYGPNQGLVTERVNKLIENTVENLDDPFLVTILMGSEYGKTWENLSDEFASLTFTPGRRVLLLKNISDQLVKDLEWILDSQSSDVLVIFEAGNLRPKSPLRRTFEGAKRAAALPCYSDGPEELYSLVRERFTREGKELNASTLNFLVGRLSNDRGINQQELNKLLTYIGRESAELEENEIAQVINTSTDLPLEELNYAVGSGELTKLDLSVQSIFHQGLDSITVLRAVSDHLQRVAIAIDHIGKGMSIKVVMGNLRPPVFFKKQKEFSNQTKIWTFTKLNQAQATILQAEIDCKKMTTVQQTICERALIRVGSLTHFP